jgi:hypothetical protein
LLSDLGTLNGEQQKKKLNYLYKEITKLKNNFHATRGISVLASYEEIWKWIIQIGSMRAGWYSIGWIDNGETPSTHINLLNFK